jgi:DNA-binding MarR family transcriptional regulator
MINLFPERNIGTNGEAPAEATLDAVERWLMSASRRLLFEVAADSPLWDLPLPQIRALHLISRRPSCAMGHVAERLGVAMSTATQIADRLEQRGWVRRADDPEDRRVVRLSLTEEGRRVVDERRHLRRERLGEALGGMLPEKREALLVGLQALGEAIGGSRERGCRHASSLLDWVREDLGADTAPD